MGARGGAALVCAMAAAVGCARERASGPQLSIAVATDVVSLDPHLQNDLATQAILGNLYEALVSFDADMRVLPALAERWESPDELTWRFRLREASFHDGRKMSARDVVFSLHRAARDPKSKMSGYLATMREARTVGARMVEITTVRSYPILLNKLAVVAIVPDGSPAEIREPVGTGAYRLARRAPGESVELEAFEGYWGGMAAERRARFLVVPDLARRVDLLRQGEVDLVSRLGVEEFSRVQAAPGCRVASRPGLTVYNLGARVDRAPLSDVRLRRAIDLALDRPAMVRALLGGRGIPVGQSISPPVFGYAPDIAPTERDLAAARRLVAAAGFPDGVELTLEHASTVASYGAVIAGQLGEAGFRVKTTVWPWTEFYQRLLAGHPDFFIVGFTCDTADATDMLDLVLHSRDPGAGYGAHNFSHYANPRFDLILQRSGETPRVAERLDLLRDAIRVAKEDLPLIPLFALESAYGMRDDLAWEPRLDQKLHVYPMRRSTKHFR